MANKHGRHTNGLLNGRKYNNASNNNNNNCKRSRNVATSEQEQQAFVMRQWPAKIYGLTAEIASPNGQMVQLSSGLSWVSSVRMPYFIYGHNSVAQIFCLDTWPPHFWPSNRPITKIRAWQICLFAA